MISFPHRPNGPLLCDLQGKFRATLKGVDEEEQKNIYIYGFKNRQMSFKSKDTTICQYSVYNEDGTIGEEAHEVMLKELLEMIDCVPVKPVEEKKLEVEIIEIKPKKTKKKKGAKK